MPNANLTFSPFTTTVPGYPRVATGRVYKTLLEHFWNHRISVDDFQTGINDLVQERLQVQLSNQLDHIPVGDFSLYDHVLDTAIQFGCIPERFDHFKRGTALELYFAMARGKDGVPPLEMTKWFDTNYHYLVPEIPSAFYLHEAKALDQYQFAKEIIGERAKPVLLGPFSFLKLARLSDQDLVDRLQELVPLYCQVIQSLVEAGASYIQLDEPSLVTDISETESVAFQTAYHQIGKVTPVIIQTYFGDIARHYNWLKELPIGGLGVDFVRGKAANLTAIQSGFPSDKILVAGVVDGRNIWRSDLNETQALVKELAQYVSLERIVLSSSCSLLHLPETVSSEDKLPADVKSALCFAQERLGELRLLSNALQKGNDSVSEDWNLATKAFQAWQENQSRFIPDVQQRVESITDKDTSRLAYAQRRPFQDQALNLPPLPTTTIGSFPQTPELRKARTQRESSPEFYEQAIKNEIQKVVALQEDIGLDVLVHGEPERNDMVQFFGDQMQGFTTTEEGWVQSYGSRCVRPPIIYGDVARLQPMTVKELAYAQSLTQKPMKGMLTGPITILQWSFVREDIARSQVAYQIAIAIRGEVHDLEEAGLKIIQIDEAAFREGLPLRKGDWQAYSDWAIKAFRLATSGAKPTTQIHTHMCYSEFEDMIEAIAAMDADVISIEDARSDGALLETLKEFQYPLQIGPGVYDIHSPNVPTVEFIENKLQATLKRLSLNQVWVNPDCGLKTRKYEEMIPSLKNLVEAAKRVRACQKA